jgi:hypothetical protein
MFGHVRASCVSISLGVGGLYVAYPFLGAMRRPETRDRREERLYSHVFFVSLSFGSHPIFKEQFHYFKVCDQPGEKLAGVFVCIFSSHINSYY